MLLLVGALFFAMMQAQPASAQVLTEGWGGITPGSNDYNHIINYRTPSEACKSSENSLPPGLGVPVYGLLNVRGTKDQVDPADGRYHPATNCVMDAGNGEQAVIIILFRCGTGNKIAQESCVPSSYPEAAEPDCSECGSGNVGSPAQFPSLGDPVSISSGAKTETVTDYSSGGADPIVIKRTYRSMMSPSSGRLDGMGLGWRLNLVGTMIDVVTPSKHVVVRRLDGTRMRFQNPAGTAAGTWKPYTVESDATGAFSPQADAKDKFVQNNGTGTNFSYTDENNVTYTYSSAFANLMMPIRSIATPNGRSQQFEYGVGEGIHPTRILHGLSGYINLTWSGDVITSIVVPDGTKIAYTYQKQVVDGVEVLGSEVLTGVSRYRPNGTLIDSVSYEYDRSKTATPLLTGRFDAAGVKIDSTTYDGYGRVLTAQGPGGAGAISIAYNDATSTRTVTNALGQVDVYTFARNPITGSNIPSMFAVSSISRQPSATVVAATKVQKADTLGALSEITDWNGKVTKFTNDATGREIQRVEDFNGLKRTTSTTWSTTFQLPTKIVAPNLTTDLTYDTAGRLTQRKETDTSKKNGPVRIWTYAYDTRGLLLSVTGPRTDVVQTTTYTYRTNTTFLASVKDALGRVTTINTVNAAGQPTRITDPNGVVTNLTYDPLGRLTSTSVAGPVAATTTFGYDANGLLTTVTSPTGVTQTYGYDAAHRLTSITDSAGNKTTFTLDAMGNRTQAQIQTANAQVLMANSSTYDSLGRLLTSLGATNQTTSFQYDNNGNPVRVTDPRNAVTLNAFDGLNRLVQTTDALNAVTKTGYDGLDNVTSVTDPRLHATTYTVNGFGFVTSVVSPDTGTTTYTYDLAGNVLSRKDARAIVTNYTYDALDRPLTRSYPSAPAENVTFGYDSTLNGNKGIGRLTSLTDAAGTATFTYDAYGNRVAETRTVAGLTYATSYGYDLAGQLTRITYPSGAIVNYQRDTLGQVSGVTWQAGSTATPISLAGAITYLPFGPMKTATLGNGVQLTDSYDADYRLTGRQAVGTATLQSLTLGYDGAGNITAITDGVAANLSQTYQYDLVGRVKQGTGGWGTDNYTYDGMGNRLTRSLVNSNTTSISYTYTAANTRLATAVQGATTLSYAYAADGSLLTRKIGTATQSSYTYNADGRLATSGGATRKYNAFGERAVETITGGGTHFVFSPDGLLLAEHNVNGTRLREYVYLNGQPLAMIDAAGTVSYILNDQLGQPQKMLDAGGGITWSRVSGIYGDTVTQLAGTTAANPQRFPGQQYDPFTNLHYNYFRDYDPATGRYVEADPIGLEGGVNLYAYVGGNPVTWADPKGLDKYNLFPFAEPSMQQAADREYQDLPRTVRDGRIHIFGHASKNVFCVYSRSRPYCLNPAQLVKWMGKIT